MMLMEKILAQDLKQLIQRSGVQTCRGSIRMAKVRVSRGRGLEIVGIRRIEAMGLGVPRWMARARNRKFHQ